MCRKCARDRQEAAAALEARAAPYREVLSAHAFSSIALDRRGHVQQPTKGHHDVKSLGPSLQNALSMVPRDAQQAADMCALSHVAKHNSNHGIFV
jgi:hypothetical protein